MAINDILGKVVTITGNQEVGYGASGDSILGVVTKIEPYGTGVLMLGFDGLEKGGTFKLSATTGTAIGATEPMLVTVEWGKTFEGIPTNTTAPAAGDELSVDGAGKVKSVATVVGLNAVAISVDGTAKTATIKVS